MHNINAEQAVDANMKDSINDNAPGIINVSSEVHHEDLSSKTSVPPTSVEEKDRGNAENAPSNIAKDEATVLPHKFTDPAEPVNKLRHDNLKIINPAYSQLLTKDKIIHGKNKYINNLENTIKKQLVAVKAYNTPRDDYFAMKQEYEDKLASIKTELNGMVGLSKRMMSCASMVVEKRDNVKRLIDEEESEEEPEPESVKIREGEVIIVDSSEDGSVVPKEPAVTGDSIVTQKPAITEQPVVAEEVVANEKPLIKRVKFTEGV
ncbi:hypothetical protein E4T39_04969 [Aureobasidium subglaciale]|nr:hypothetical protein E4T39_04969 [Aureobasidium subglaciale]